MVRCVRRSGGWQRGLALPVIVGLLAACGGGGSKPPPPAPTYRIGGTVSGLVGTVVLQNNAAGSVSVSNDGAFTVTASASAGTAYAVTIASQPALQTCTVLNGTGTVTTSVTDVLVQCSNPVLTVTPRSVKTLRMSWTAPGGATAYKIFEDPTGNGAFTQIGANLPAGTTTFDHPVSLHLRANARYKLQACAGATCLDSNAVSVAGTLASAIGYFKASNAESLDRFGPAALSADGSTLAIGAFEEDSAATRIDGDPSNNAATDAGAVYVFARIGGAWSQQAYIKSSHAAAFDEFGWSLSLSADGNNLAVSGGGAVDLFARIGTTWNEETVLRPSSPNALSLARAAVAFSADGNTVVMGVPSEDSGATGIDGDPTGNAAPDSGAAFVFVRNGTAWAQQAYLKASNAQAGDEFGSSVALSADGRTLAVSAAKEDSAATGVDGDQSSNGADGSGAAYVFVRVGSRWSQQAYLKASNTGSGDDFAIHLALSGDGNTLAVGADGEDSGAAGVGGDQSSNAVLDPGAAYVFTRNGATWAQQAYLKSPRPMFSDFFGHDVALSADGNLLVVGAPGESFPAVGVDPVAQFATASTAGAAFVFTRGASTWTPGAYVKASNTDAQDGFGIRLALSGDGGTLLVSALGESSAATTIGGNAADNSARGAGAAYLY